ncbi:MAG: GGDEF domain-containing protein [Leptospirillia bacterium]
MNKCANVMTAPPLSVMPCLESLSRILSGPEKLLSEVTRGEPLCPILSLLPEMEGDVGREGGPGEATLPCEGKRDHCIVPDPAEIVAFSLWRRGIDVAEQRVNYQVLGHRLLEALSRAEGETEIWQAVSETLRAEPELLFADPSVDLTWTGRPPVSRGRKGMASGVDPAGRSLVEEALCSGEPRILRATAPDRHVFSESSLFASSPELSVVAAWPMSSPVGDSTSVILLGASEEGFFDSPFLRSFLRDLSSWSAIALSRIRHLRALENLSVRDSLTGLLNRRGLAVAFSSFYANIKRRKTMGLLGVVDLDDFKPVNDTWGHAAGDVLLEEVAARLRKLLRESDLVGRVGGDEFVFVSELSDSKGLARLTERISRAFSHPFVLPEGQEVSIALSCGLVRFSQEPVELGHLLRSADCALYKAKRNKNSLAKFFEFRETAGPEGDGGGGDFCGLSGREK